jgi:hypothetical protein
MFSFLSSYSILANPSKQEGWRFGRIDVILMLLIRKLRLREVE